MTPSLVLAVVFACLSGVTYGYDICVIAGALKDMTEFFEDCSQELIVACMSIGVLVSRAAGWGLADKFGRIKSLILADLFIIASILATVFTSSTEVLLTARFALGIGIGLALLVGPTYLSEISPNEYRGRLITLHELSVCIGSFLGMAASLAFPSASWQIKLGVSAIPSLAQLAMTFALPESPLWLIGKGFSERALVVRKKLGLKDEEVLVIPDMTQASVNGTQPPSPKPARNLTELQLSPSSMGSLENLEFSSPEKSADSVKTWKFLFSTYKVPLLVAVAVAVAGSASGFYAVQAFSVSLVLKFLPDWTEVGAARVILPIFGAAKVGGVFVCYFLIDLLGRRAVLIASLLLMAISNCLVLAAIGLEGARWVGVGGVGGIMFGWSLGVGSMMLLVANELLPTNLRAIGSSIALSATSIVEVFYHLVFPSLLENAPLVPFSLFLVYCVFAALLTLKCVPETVASSLH